MMVALFALAAAAAESAGEAGICGDANSFVANGNTGCVSFPEIATMPRGPFAISDDYPMPYFVTAPCQNVTKVQTNCTGFADGTPASPAWAVAGTTCYALGSLDDMSFRLLDPADAHGGVLITYGNGVAGRVVTFKLTCDPSAPPGQGPTRALEHQPVELGYVIEWSTSAVCSPMAVSCNLLPPVPDPKPSTELLLYQEMEMGALVCYNMATADHTQGCAAKTVPPASTFLDSTPTKADTDQWCQAIASFGGKYATMVVKHVCGFLIWPSNASSGNFTYNYGVPPGRDLIAQFAESCAGVGVKLGLYYSLTANTYLNYPALKDPAPGQASITQEQYNDIVTQHLTELWTNYGELAEIWFDGGFGVPGLKEQLLELYNRTQPNAAVFNGCGLMPDNKNAVIWIGTESGHAPYPVWSTQTGCASGAGSATGESYVPKEVDLTLQNSDTWFYQEGRGYRSLAEMVSIYHDSVGHGGNMLLNIAPPPNSTLPQKAMDTYAALGNFIRNCYGEGSLPAESALASTTSFGASNTTSVALSFSGGGAATFDRIIIKEELREGQNVLDFVILADDKHIFNGTAIGRTLIVLLPTNITASRVELKVLRAKKTPSFRLFAIPDPSSCSVHNKGSSGCDLIEDTQYLGAPFSTTTTASVSACCAACATEPKCAFFTATDTAAHSSTCKLMVAQQGSRKVKGVVSGSPKR